MDFRMDIFELEACSFIGVDILMYHIHEGVEHLLHL